MSSYKPSTSLAAIADAYASSSDEETSDMEMVLDDGNSNSSDESDGEVTCNAATGSVRRIGQTGTGARRQGQPSRSNPNPWDDEAVGAEDADADDVHPVEHYYTVEDVEEASSTSRNTRVETTTLRLHNWEDSPRPDRLFERIVHALQQRLLETHAGTPPSMLGMELVNPKMRSPFYLPVRPLEQNTPSVMAAAFENLQQSEEELELFQHAMQCRLFAIWPLQVERGGCSDSAHRFTMNMASSLVCVQNADTHCLVRSVLIGMMDVERRRKGSRLTMAAYRHFADAASDEQKAALADTLRCFDGTVLDATQEGGYDLADVQAVQEFFNVYLPNVYRLVVFQHTPAHGTQLVWKSDKPAPNDICLYWEQQHWGYVGEPHQLFPGCRYFCVDCGSQLTRRNTHPLNCPAVCRRCLRCGYGFPCRMPSCSLTPLIRCADCGFTFMTTDCYEHHQRRESESAGGRGLRCGPQTVCEMKRICQECGRIYYTRNGHRCGERDEPQPCTYCKEVHSVENPFCYIQTIETPDADDDDSAETASSASDAQQQRQHAVMENESRIRYVFFDAECSQEKRMQLEGGTHADVYKHECLLIAAEVICVACIDAGISTREEDDERMADDCVCGLWASDHPRRYGRFGGEQHRYSRRLLFDSFNDADAEPVWQFCQYLMSTGPSVNVQTIAISHNGGKYDMHLCLESLYAHNIRVKLLTRGMKMYQMKVRHNKRTVIFKDSLNFFFAPLAALRAAYRLEAECAEKPHFPHLYTQRTNLFVERRHLPELEYYDVGRLMPAEREQHLTYYAQNNDYYTASGGETWNLARQLVTYCLNDVRLLGAACLVYRNIFLRQAGVDPFVVANTVAKLAQVVYFKCYMPPRTLINAPEKGYRLGDRASVAARKFFRFYADRHPLYTVRTADWSSGEARVGDTGYRLDALVTRSFVGKRPLAIEFMGCYFHGCPRCYAAGSQLLAGGRSAEELYERTMRRIAEIRRLGLYKIRLVWECEWNAYMQSHPRVARGYHRLALPAAPMQLRTDAYYGGRVEAFRMLHKCSTDEEIVCVDVVSLYPSVMKHGAYPLHNPTVLTRETVMSLSPLPWCCKSANRWRGFLHVRVLPPQRLRYPLLPYRTANGQLHFTLCARCSELEQQAPCHHLAHQRAWIAAYTHAELNKALALGYVVLDVFEVWHYDEWGALESGNGLFDGFVNAHLKMKVEASGWPADARTSEERDEFVREYADDEGIELDAAEMEKSPARKSAAKLMLNALYGKFGQKSEGRLEVHIARSPAAFHEFMADQHHTVHSFVHVSEQLDRITYKRPGDTVQAPYSNSLPVACFVTSYARLKLYSYLEEAVALGLIVLYCDTDSLYYVLRIGQKGVTEGRRLGQMARENAHLRLLELIAAGAKNYAFRYVARDDDDGEQGAVLKVRGFRLNYDASQLITFDRMRQLILRKYFAADAPPVDELIEVPTMEIGRTVRSDLYTRRSTKKWRVKYNKGIVDTSTAHLNVWPFGYMAQ